MMVDQDGMRKFPKEGSLRLWWIGPEGTGGSPRLGTECGSELIKGAGPVEAETAGRSGGEYGGTGSGFGAVEWYDGASDAAGFVSYILVSGEARQPPMESGLANTTVLLRIA